VVDWQHHGQRPRARAVPPKGPQPPEPAGADPVVPMPGDGVAWAD